MNIYLVGGAVRDMLLGRLPREWDYAFDGSREAFLSTHPGAEIAGAVRVCLWQGCEFMPLRGGSLHADLHARDLTINALALDAAGRLHCHPQALGDLRHRLLRPASSSALADDPGRAFRLARFAACLPDWQLAPEAEDQLRLLDPAALAALPAERVGRELLKALAGPAPSRFLRVLAAGGCLSPWFAELDEAARIPAGPPRWHGKNSVLDHTCEVMDRCAGDALAVWMALCHDLGKLRTPADNWPHHYGHDALGVPVAQELCRRLALSNLHLKAAETACADHMCAGRYGELRTGTRRDILWRVERRGLSRPFWRLVDADSRRQWSLRAEKELAILLAVRLPEEWRDRGPESARQLRDLQCAALAESRCRGLLFFAGGGTPFTRAKRGSPSRALPFPKRALPGNMSCRGDTTARPSSTGPPARQWGKTKDGQHGVSSPQTESAALPAPRQAPARASISGP